MPDQTPQHGIPFPVPNDALTDYPALGADLAQMLEGMFGRLVQRYVCGGPNEIDYIVQEGAVALLVECIGGGGGGGANAPTAAGQVCGASGGGGGGYASTLLHAPLKSVYHARVAAGGAGGVPGPGGAWGSPGGDTVFLDGPSVSDPELVAGRGGGPGAQCNPGYPSWAVGGGGGGTAMGELMLVGGPGGSGLNISGSPHIPVGGHGGDAARGGGGAPAPAGGGTNGYSANIYGGGGSGAAGNPGEGSRPGGSGAAGVLIVTAFLGVFPATSRPAPEEPDWFEYPLPPQAEAKE